MLRSGCERRACAHDEVPVVVRASGRAPAALGRCSGRDAARTRWGVDRRAVCGTVAADDPQGTAGTWPRAPARGAAPKTVEGAQHPDRNAQFEYISRLTQGYLR